jgi:hypothetical protein
MFINLYCIFIFTLHVFDRVNNGDDSTFVLTSPKNTKACPFVIRALLFFECSFVPKAYDNLGVCELYTRDAPTPHEHVQKFSNCSFKIYCGICLYDLGYAKHILVKASSCCLIGMECLLPWMVNFFACKAGILATDISHFDRIVTR